MISIFLLRLRILYSVSVVFPEVLLGKVLNSRSQYILMAKSLTVDMKNEIMRPREKLLGENVKEKS